MTSLQITPNWKNKTAKFKGTIAAGEHVAVSIANDDNFIADATNLRLRVVNPANGKTLAQFPMPDADGEDGEEAVLPSSETPAEGEVDWASDVTPLYGILNLNTDRMLMAVPPGANVPLLFVLDDYEGKTLYFKDMCEVTHWPRRVGEEEPTRLDDYKDLIADFRERIDAAEATVAAAAASIASAVDEASGIVSRAETAEVVAGAFKNQAVSAKNAAVDAKDAALVAQGLAETAQGKAEDAQAAAETAQTAAETAQGKAEDAQEAAEDAAEAAGDAAEAAVATEKIRAEAAEEALDDAIEVEETRATEAETALANNLAGAFKAVSYDSTNKKIVFTKQNGTTDSIDASAFIKDGMVSSVAISNGNLVISFNTDAGQSPISIPLTNIFNPANYYDKTAANNTFVAKEQGKGLTSNDFTTAYKDKLDGIEVGAEKNVGVEYTQTEKTKLSGVEAGAKDNVVEAASASAFPQQGAAGKIYVAKDENKTYRWGGAQYVQIGGGGGSSVEVVAPSTDPADAGKAADAKATGDALAGKRSVTDLGVRGLPTRGTSGNYLTVNGQVAQCASDDGVYTHVYNLGGLYVEVNDDGIVTVFVGGGSGYSIFDSEYIAEVTIEGGTADGEVYKIVSYFDTLARASETATKADAALTPVYGGNGEKYSEWRYSQDTIEYQGATVAVGPMRFVFDQFGETGFWFVKAGSAEIQAMNSDIDATEVYFYYGAFDEHGEPLPLVATRTANPVVGYTLGTQSAKPLQPQGNYAPATNIPKTALAQDVQTSLGRADTAVQPAALPGAVRYDLPANATAISSASSEVVEGETVTYGAATLADRTENRVEVTAAIAELRLTFPAAVSGKVRDFGLRVEVGDGTAALTAPALVPVAPTGETITLENSDGAIPALADGAATAAGVTLLYFSETAPGKFLVKGEQVQEA